MAYAKIQKVTLELKEPRSEMLPPVKKGPTVKCPPPPPHTHTHIPQEGEEFLQRQAKQAKLDEDQSDEVDKPDGNSSDQAATAPAAATSDDNEEAPAISSSKETEA